MDAQACADGVGARERLESRLEMGGEKGPVGTSVDARMCAEGVGGRDVGNEWGEGPVGMSERGCGEMCGQFVQGKGERGGEKGRWA